MNKPKQKVRQKVRLQCQECGKIFHRSLATYDIQCPKCNSVDIYPVEAFGERSAKAIREGRED